MILFSLTKKHSKAQSNPTHIDYTVLHTMQFDSQVVQDSQADVGFADKHRVLCNTSTKRVLIQPGVYATIQTSHTGELLLTGNTCFFDDPDAGKLIAVASRDTLIKPDELNNKSAYDGIDKIIEANDKITWFFVVGTPGQYTAQLHDLTLQVALEPAAYPANPGPKLTNSTGSWDATLIVEVDGQQISFEPNLTAAVTTASIRLLQVGEGVKTLKVFLKNKFKGKLGVGVLRYVKVTSSVAASSFSVLRARWRPSAAHTTFRCSKTSNVSAWVCKQRKVEDALLGAFSPMSSGTGYMGISMDSTGTAGNSMPFSAWVHGDNEPVPPTNEWHVFTAIGHPTAHVRVFRHEGTGEKIEGYDTLLDGNTSKDYITCLTLNAQPFAKFSDGVLLTYRAFWFDEHAVRPTSSPAEAPEKGMYRLYAELQAFKARYADLKVGGFIEVTGGSDEQKTGHVVRGVRYQIHARDKTTKTWHLVDKMQVGEAGKITEKNWTVDGDHFEVRSGGMFMKLLPSTKEVGLASVPAEQPAYIKYISDVDNFSMPYPSIVMLQPGQPNEAMVTQEVTAFVDVPGFVEGEVSTIEVYYGPQDQLTMMTEWPFSVKVTATSKTMQVVLKTEKFVVSDLPAGVSLPQTGYGGPENTVLGFNGTLFARVRFGNSSFQTFSLATATTSLPIPNSQAAASSTAAAAAALPQQKPQRPKRACSVNSQLTSTKPTKPRKPAKAKLAQAADQTATAGDAK